MMNGSNLTLWYTEPAAEWIQALPVGNGRLGAMVFGCLQNERLQLNEETIWARPEGNGINPEALAALPEVRRLLFEGKDTEASRLAEERMLAKLSKPRN